MDFGMECVGWNVVGGTEASVAGEKVDVTDGVEAYGVGLVENKGRDKALLAFA